MAGKSQARKAELVQKLLDGVDRRLEGDKRALARRFVERYYEGVAHEDMLEMTPADLEGSALGVFAFADRRRPGQPKVRVYNPAFEEHGWHSTHTIVELINRDRPFLVDSVIAALNRQDLTVHLLIHPVIRVRRDRSGHLIAVGEAEGKRESVVHVQVSQQLSRERLEEIEAELRTVLEDVRVAVDDWKPMLDQIEAVITELKTTPPPLPADEVEEGRAFLEWIRDDNFTFLGYRDYQLVSKGGKDYLEIVEGSGLGVLRQVSEESARRHDAPISRALARFARRKALLIITKANAKSTVHRPVYLDYIGIRRFDRQGEVIGERRFLGLFTSAAYNRNPSEIPLLRRKVRRVMKRAGFRPGGHNAKALENILDTYPRDELFQIRVDELFETAQGIRHLEERQRIRLFVRRDSYARFLSCLVYVPRERYNTELRQRFETILIEALKANAIEFTTRIADAPMARVHFIVRTSAEPPPYDVAEIEAQLVAASRAWTDELRDALIERWGEGRGNVL
ncbi:MAG: NAD-glutamate dehydrogenase, partial [Kiloniellales bacterium]